MSRGCHNTHSEQAIGQCRRGCRPSGGYVAPGRSRFDIVGLRVSLCASARQVSAR